MAMPGTTRRFPYALWGHIPLGYDDLTFGSGHVTWRRRRYCCGGQGERRFARDNTTKVRASKRPPCLNPLLIIRDVFLSFVTAFLFHLIPSIIWGAEESLGTPENHQSMGSVWLWGWPVFGCLFLGATLNVRGVLVEQAGRANPCFISLTHFTGDLAVRVAHTFTEHPKLGVAASADDLEISTTSANTGSVQFLGTSDGGLSTWRAPTIAGVLFWSVLWINGIVTAVLVQTCMARGCCLDDATTYVNCTTTGLPN